MSELKIRDAQVEDAQRLLEIYSHYVLNTAVSFEYEVPTLEEFSERIRSIKKKYPYLVCEKNGKIILRKQLLGIPSISSTKRQKAVVPVKTTAFALI